jgi:hypothetical protein
MLTWLFFVLSIYQNKTLSVILLPVILLLVAQHYHAACYIKPTQMTNSYLLYFTDLEVCYEMQQYCNHVILWNKWLNIPVGLASMAKEVQNLQIYF